MNITVCALLYGDYPELHKLFITRLVSSISPNIPLYLGTNSIGIESMDILKKHLSIDPKFITCNNDVNIGRIRVYTKNNTNCYKYPVMRRMMSDIGDNHILWLDDDTILPGNTSWLDQLQVMFNSGIDYTGVEYYMHFSGNQATFIKSRPWYKGLPFNTKGNKPCFVFYTGGFFGLSNKAIKALDWPDTNLRHNGGDTLLGEAVRQNKFKRKAFSCNLFDIKVNSKPRRGYREPPVGTTL